MKKIITILMALALASVPIGATEDDNSARIAEIEKQIAEYQTQIENLETELNELKGDTASNFVYETDECVYTYKDAKVIDFSDEQYIEVIFDFTNNGDITTSALDAFYEYNLEVQAYQDGISLSTTRLFGSDIEKTIEMGYTEIKPGVTVEAGIIFTKQSDSDIEIEFQQMGENYQPDPDTLQTLTISLK